MLGRRKNRAGWGRECEQRNVSAGREAEMPVRRFLKNNNNNNNKKNQHYHMIQQSHYWDPEKTAIQKDTFTQMFVVALFTIARTWKQFKFCPSTDE